MSNSEQHSTFWMGKLLERIVAITVLLCFFLTTCLGDVFIETCHAGVQTALDVESFAKSLTNLSDCADFDIGTFVLPRNLGQVNDLWEATLTNGGQETSRVIHIQDAHCNYEAQQKIAEIIEYFQKTYGVDTVNLEGGEGAYNLSLFTDILDRVVRKKVSDYFVSQGIVNGAEFFAINNHIKEKEVTLWGVEDTTLYVENLKIYRNFLEHKNTAETYLNQLDSLLDNLKHNIYSKEFLEFDAKYIEYKEDKLDVKDYIPYLFQKAIEKDVSLAAFPNVQILFQSLDEEKNINFERANKEREVLIDSLKKKLSKNSFKDLAVETIKFKEGQTSNEEFYNLLINKAKTVNVSIKSFPEFQKYIRYIAVYNAMDKALLMDELENLESEIKEKLYKRDKERELDLLSKHLVLTKNLMNIRLTQKDYEYYKEHEKQFNVKHYLKFIRKEAPRYGINAEPNQSIYQFDVWREKLAAFYEYSFKRDKAFLKNLKFSSPSAGENREKQITILITGGFHSENLTKLFKEKNISYVSIMPNFKNGKDYESQYFSLLSGKKFETLKNLTAEVSSLALYSDFCKNVITVYSLDEIEAKKLWVKLTRAVFEDKKDIVIHNRHYSFQPIEGVLPIEGLEIDGKKVYAKNIGSRSSSNDTNLDTWQETDVALSAEKSRGNAFSSLKKMLIMPFIGGILAKARLADAASLEIIVENFGKVSWAWWVAGGILLLTAGIFAHYVIQNRNKSIQLRSKNELQEKDEEDLDLLDEEDEDIDVSPGFAGAFSSLVYKLARKLENAQEDLTLEINCSDSKNPQGNAALPKGLKLNRYEQEQISDYLDKLIEGDIKKNLMGIKDLAGKGLLPPKMTIRFSNSLVIQREESIITLPKLLFKSLATLKYILVSEFASEGMIGETALTFFRGLTWREQEEIIFYINELDNKKVIAQGVLSRLIRENQSKYNLDPEFIVNENRKLFLNEVCVDPEKGEDRFNTLYKELRGIVDRLLLAEGMNPALYEFHLLDDLEENAFVRKYSNHIYLNLGLLKLLYRYKALTKDAVASTLAHEITHLVQGRDDVDSGEVNFRLCKLSMEEYFEEMKKAYAMEYDADHKALERLDKAGFSGKFAHVFFEVMIKVLKKEKRLETMFGAYPELEERIRKIKEEFFRGAYDNYRKKSQKFSSEAVSEVTKRGFHREFEISVFNCKNFIEINEKISKAKNLRDIELIKRVGLPCILYQEAHAMTDVVYKKLSASHKNIFNSIQKKLCEAQISFGHERLDKFVQMSDFGPLGYLQYYLDTVSKKDLKIFIERVIFSHIRSALREKEVPIIKTYLPIKNESKEAEFAKKFSNLINVLTPIIKETLSENSESVKVRFKNVYLNFAKKENEFASREKYIVKIYDFSEYLKFLEGENSDEEGEGVEIVNDRGALSDFISFPVFSGLEDIDRSFLKIMRKAGRELLKEWRNYSDEKQVTIVYWVISQWILRERRNLSLEEVLKLRQLTKENTLTKFPEIFYMMQDKINELSGQDFKKYQDTWLNILKDEEDWSIDIKFVDHMKNDPIFCNKVLEITAKGSFTNFDETVAGCIGEVIKSGAKLEFLDLGKGASEDLVTLTKLFPNFNEKIMYCSFLKTLIEGYGLNKTEEMLLIEKGIWLMDLKDKALGERKPFSEKQLFQWLRNSIEALSEESIDSAITTYFENYDIAPKDLKKLDIKAKRLLYYFKAGGLLTHKDLRLKFHDLEKTNTDRELLVFYWCLRALKIDQAKRGVAVSWGAKETANLKEKVNGAYALNKKENISSFFKVRTWDEYLLYIGQYLLFKNKGLETKKLKEFNLFYPGFSGYKAFFGEMPAQIVLDEYGEKAGRFMISNLVVLTQYFLDGLIRGYKRLSRHKIMQKDEPEMFNYIKESRKDFDELLGELLMFLPSSSYLNYALYHLFIFKAVKPMTGRDISFNEMYDTEYVENLINSSPNKNVIEKKREEIRQYMCADKRVELLNLYLLRLRIKEVSDFYSLMKWTGEDSSSISEKTYIRVYRKVLLPIHIIMRLFVIKWLSLISARNISRKEYKKIYWLIELGKFAEIQAKTSEIEGLLEHLLGKRSDEYYAEEKEDELRMKLKIFLQLFCFSASSQEKFQFNIFVKHFVFQKLRVFAFFEKYILRNSVKLEDTEIGGIDSQLDIMLIYQKEDWEKIIKDKNRTWQDKFENTIIKYFPRPSNTRDFLIKTLIETHKDELSSEELHLMTKDFNQIALCEKYNLWAIEKDREENPADFEGFDNEFTKITEVYFPDYSYTRDDLLLQLVEEKVVSRPQYKKVSECLLINLDNARKEEIQNHLFWGDKLKWMIKDMSSENKADFLLWVMNAKKKKPDLLSAIETDLDIKLDHLKELFTVRHEGYYNHIGMSLRKDLLPTLLYGKGGIFTNAKTETYFLNKLFKGIIPKKTKNKDVYKKIWDAVFSVVELDRKIDIMVNLSKAFSLIPRDASGKIEKGNEGLMIRAFLESCGIIGVKLGQLLYSMDIDMSSTIRDELSGLTGSANPLAKGTTFSVMDSVFGEFQDYYLELLEPIGSASIKMVYKAKNPEDGIDQAMALKIKKPEIEQKINQELKYLSRILEVLRKDGAVDVPRNLEEKIKKQVKKELDFYLEWKNQKALAEIAEEFKELKFPESVEVNRDFIANILEGMNPEFIDRIMAEVEGGSSLVKQYIANEEIEIDIEVPVANEVLGKNKGQVMLEPLAKGKALEKIKEDQNVLQIKRETATFLLFQIFGKGMFHSDLHDGNLFVNKDNEEGNSFIASLIDLGSVGEISLKESEEFLRMYMALNINSFKGGVFGWPILGNIVSNHKLRPEVEGQITQVLKEYNPEKSIKEIEREVRSFLTKDRSQNDKARSLHKLFARLDNKGINMPESFLDLSKAMTAANSIFKDSKKNDLLSPKEMLGLIRTFMEYRRQNEVRGSPVQTVQTAHAEDMPVPNPKPISKNGITDIDRIKENVKRNSSVILSEAPNFVESLISAMGNIDNLFNLRQEVLKPGIVEGGELAAFATIEDGRLKVRLPQVNRIAMLKSIRAWVRYVEFMSAPDGLADIYLENREGEIFIIGYAKITKKDEDPTVIQIGHIDDIMNKSLNIFLADSEFSPDGNFASRERKYITNEEIVKVVKAGKHININRRNHFEIISCYRGGAHNSFLDYKTVFDVHIHEEPVTDNELTLYKEAENYITERFGKQEKSRYDSFYRNFLTIPSYGDIHSKIIFRKQVNPDYKWCGIIYRFETGRIEQFYYDMDIFTPEIKRGFMELGDKFFDKKLNKEEWQKLIELVEYIKSKALSSKQLVGKLVSQRQAMLKESQAIQVWIEGINERQFMIDFESLFADKDTLQIAVKNPKKRITLLRQQKFFRGADDNKFWHILGIRRVDNRESNITGNIIKGFTETEEKELRKGIEENSDKVRAENESAVQLVEERCAVLLKDKGNIEYLLRERGVPGDEINRVTYALEHPREAFKWFNAIVEGENRYLLGHETALAVNIVKFLIEKEAELGIDNLIDEYIFHEALENTSMEGVDGKTKHHNIIDFTSLFFRQKSYMAPHETPLGGALRVFIQGVAAPEAEISRRQSETRRAEESEYLDPSTRSLHDLAQDDSLRGAPSPISMNGMTGVDLHGSPSMNEMLGSLGSIPVRGMTEGEGSLEARSVGSPRISVPEFKPWISDVPKPEFIPLPEIAIKETSDNKESRISATLEAFSSEPVTKTRDPIAVVGLPEKIKNDTSINLEKLRGDISRGLGENGHGVPNDPHKVDFFFINPNDLETTKRGITDLLRKYNKERECVLFVPEMKDIKLKSDLEFLTDLEKEFSKHLTIVPDAYTDLDFSLKKKFVGIDERIAITRLIGYYKEAETYDESSRELAQEEALTALTVFLAKINSEEVPQAKDLKDLNQLLKNLLLKIKPVDYNDIIEWEETQKAIATSL